MDSRPFRMSRPSERDETSTPDRNASRSERAASAGLEPSRPVPTEPQPERRPERRPEGTPPVKHRPWLKIGIIAVVLVIIIGATYAWMSAQRGAGSIGIDSHAYQAVFTADGQVYFGKLHVQNGTYLKLTDAYYLENKSADAANKSDASTGLQLTKLHSKIYGPEDEVILQKDQLLYFENLKKDGQVAQLIDKDAGSK